MTGRRTHFLRDERGSMATVLVLVLPLVIGGVAFGVEVSSWLMLRRQVQNAADTAAFSGAVNLWQTDDEDDAEDRIAQVVFASGLDPARTEIEVDFIGDTGVAVDITISQPRYFTRLFTRSPLTMHARAVADFAVGEAAAACIIVLEDDDDNTFELDGDSRIDMPGCAIEVHSDDEDALDISQGAEVTAACLSVASDEVSGRLDRQLNLGCGDIVTDAPLNGDLPERLQQIVEREEESLRDFVGRVSRYRGSRRIEDEVLEPEDVGHSSGIPMMRFTSDVELRGEVTLLPGIYILDDMEFSTRNNTVIHAGSGVMFYLVDGADFDFHPGTEAEFRGLTGFDGSIFEDVVILDDRDGQDYALEAGDWTGIILAPTSDITIRGGRSMSGCFLFAARRFSLDGNSSIGLDCTDSAFDPSLYAGTGGGPGSGGSNAVIRLIE